MPLWRDAAAGAAANNNNNTSTAAACCPIRFIIGFMTAAEKNNDGTIRHPPSPVQFAMASIVVDCQLRQWWGGLQYDLCRCSGTDGRSRWWRLLGRSSSSGAPGELLLLGYSSPKRQGEVNQLYYQSLLMLQQWPTASTRIARCCYCCCCCEIKLSLFTVSACCPYGDGGDGDGGR
jgi:hypothetical protein